MAKTKQNITSPIKVTFDQPIAVQTLPPAPPAPAPYRAWWKAAFLLIIVSIITALAGNAFFLFGVQAQTASLDQIPLAVTVEYPSQISLKDSFTVTASLRNTGADVFNGRLDLLIAPADFFFLTKNGAAGVEVKDLPPGGVFTQAFEFSLLQAPQNNELRLRVRAHAEEIGAAESPAWTLRVLPLPRIKTLIAWLLGGSGILSALTALFWDKLKKSF